MTVSKEKQEALKRRMESCFLKEADIVEKFILGSGKGGQKINKTASCVYLKHLPTGFEVKCQQARSRELNRYIARRELCEKIERKIFQKKSEKEQEIAKIRRQKRRRSRRQKENLFQEKKHRSAVKTARHFSGDE